MYKKILQPLFQSHNLIFSVFWSEFWLLFTFQNRKKLLMFDVIPAQLRTYPANPTRHSSQRCWCPHRWQIWEVIPAENIYWCSYFKVISSLPWIHRMSSFQTSYHNFDHRRGTKWCQFDRWIWIFQEEYRYTDPRQSPPRWLGRFHRTSRQRWNVFFYKGKQIFYTKNVLFNIIFYDDFNIFSVWCLEL